ncbi:hypothetical protein D3C71_2103450 [compost metagenome]
MNHSLCQATGAGQDVLGIEACRYQFGAIERLLRAPAIQALQGDQRRLTQLPAARDSAEQLEEWHRTH